MKLVNVNIFMLFFTYILHGNSETKKETKTDKLIRNTSVKTWLLDQLLWPNAF